MLFQDVMIDMDIKDQFESEEDGIHQLIKREQAYVGASVHFPFTPTKTTQAQMDDMAQQMWAEHSEYIKRLFDGIEDLKPEGGGWPPRS